MGKRARAASLKVVASPAKAPRLEPAPGAADPLLEACHPIFEALKTLHSEGSQSSIWALAEMLCAALPRALKRRKVADKRHDFQEEILGSVERKLSAAVADQKGAVLAVERSAADLEAEIAHGPIIEEGIIARLAEKLRAYEEAEAEAELVAVAAEDALRVAYEASIAAQNAWAEETNTESQHKAKMAASASAAEMFRLKLGEEHVKLASLQGVCDTFQALRHSAKATAAVETSVVEDEAAASSR